MDNGKKTVRVCQGPWCSRYGSSRIMAKVEKETGLKAGEENDTMNLDYCKCRGYCSSGPNVEVQDEQGNIGMIFYAEGETVMDEINSGGAEVDKGPVEINLSDDFLGDI